MANGVCQKGTVVGMGAAAKRLAKRLGRRAGVWSRLSMWVAFCVGQGRNAKGVPPPWTHPPLFLYLCRHAYVLADSKIFLVSSAPI